MQHAPPIIRFISPFEICFCISTAVKCQFLFEKVLASAMQSSEHPLDHILHPRLSAFSSLPPYSTSVSSPLLFPHSHPGSSFWVVLSTACRVFNTVRQGLIEKGIIAGRYQIRCLAQFSFQTSCCGFPAVISTTLLSTAFSPLHQCLTSSKSFWLHIHMYDKIFRFYTIIQIKSYKQNLCAKVIGMKTRVSPPTTTSR